MSSERAMKTQPGRPAARRVPARVRMVLAAAVLASLTGSCTRGRVVNYEQYERIPNTAASATFRFLAKSTPVTNGKAFYGNYGGPGNSGGRPRDEMDELFRRHDIVYYLARSKENMRTADEELVEGLNALDAQRLGSHAVEFRERAVGFFGSPVSNVIGKPWGSFVRFKEPADAFFHSPAAVRDFFAEDHPGMPVGGGRESEVGGQWSVVSGR